LHNRRSRIAVLTGLFFLLFLFLTYRYTPIWISFVPNILRSDKITEAVASMESFILEIGDGFSLLSEIKSRFQQLYTGVFA